jgi:hypothetical protein
MKALIWFFFILAAFILQTQVSIFEMPLNLTVVLAYGYGLRAAGEGTSIPLISSPEMKSTAFGAFVGFLEDILTGIMIGPDLMSKALAGFVTAIAFGDVFFRWSPLLGGLVLAALTLIDGTLVLCLRLLFTEMTVNGLQAFYVIGVQALMNIGFGIILKPIPLR